MTASRWGWQRPLGAATAIVAAYGPNILAVRLFVAIELPDSSRQHLLAVQSAIATAAESLTLPSPKKLHLTLKFLGAVPDAESLVESLHKVRRSGPLVLAAQALECFPLRGPIRVVGAAIGGDAAGLLGLQRGIEQRCARLGFVPENRPFRPHITLARARIPLPQSARATLASACDSHWPGPAFSVDAFTLIQSQLRPTGSVYLPLQRFDFTTKA